MFEHLVSFFFCVSDLLQFSEGEKKIEKAFFLWTFFPPPLSVHSPESLPVNFCISLSSLPLWFSSHNSLPLWAPGLEGTEVVGGQIRFLYNNGNSIRKWRGGGHCRVSNLGLHFPESSRLAGRDIRRRSNTRRRSAGWEEDREVRHPTR